MIIDAFQYAGEYNALEIRLHELQDVVDQFVIIEGIQTFRGGEKPLYLDHIWPHLAQWHDRIHRVIVEHYPQTKDPWKLEHFQRDQVRRGLDEIGAPKDAIVIVSDADEIPSARAIAKINPWAGHVHLDFNTYYYYIDWKVPDRWNQGGRPFVAVYEQMGSPQEMRDDVRRLILNGAWHFSYLGSPYALRTKIKSFAHSEYDKHEYSDVNRLREYGHDGIDPFDRFALEPVEVDDSYPRWIQENAKTLPHLFRPREEAIDPKRRLLMERRGLATQCLLPEKEKST